ncbi:MAG: hypothetical protein GC161_09770 [Planctomycetaceae bacterium]|nr:hypothetical protein [Planctomycetaceae bacterium]
MKFFEPFPSFAAAFLGALALFAAPPQSAVAQTPAAGTAVAPAPSFSGSLRELQNGEFLQLTSSALSRLSPTGAVLQTYLTFAPTVFGGCFRVAPDESFAIVGESTNGELFRLDLPSGPIVSLGFVPFNYDVAISDAGDVIVSAAVQSFQTNDLVRVDPFTGQQETIGVLDGPSGPLDFDAAGNLFYATQSSAFPTPLGSVEVLLWLSPQVQAGSLSESNAIVYEFGFDGISSLTVDRRSGFVYAAETNFSAGYLSNVRRITQTGFANPTLFSAPPGAFLSFAPLLEGAGAGIFAPFQPAPSGHLRVSWNDFAGNSGVRNLKPARPVASFTGPGASGIGDTSFVVTGGPLSGLAVAFIGPTSSFGPTEVAVTGPNGFPLLTALDLGAVTLLPGLFAFDAAGEFSFDFFHGGELAGIVSAQVVAIDTFYGPVGTSTTANL